MNKKQPTIINFSISKYIITKKIFYLFFGGGRDVEMNSLECKTVFLLKNAALDVILILFLNIRIVNYFHTLIDLTCKENRHLCCKNCNRKTQKQRLWHTPRCNLRLFLGYTLFKLLFISLKRTAFEHVHRSMIRMYEGR